MATLLAITGAWVGDVTAATEIRRDLTFIRPLLMGDAYVAVGDEYSTLYYNPAGPGRAPANVVEVIPVLAFEYNDLVKQGLTDPNALSAKYQNLTTSQFQDLLNTTAYLQVTPLRVLVARESGWAIGLSVEALANIQVLGNPILPSLRVEFFGDGILFASFAGKWGDSLAVGITPKVIYRQGLDRTFTFGELYASGATLDLQNQPDFKTAQKKAYVSGGADIGWIWDLPFWEDGHPRIGFSALNIGGFDSKTGTKGIEFGSRPTRFDPPIGGVLPQLNTVGFAISPVWERLGVRFTFAIDVVDVTETVLPGDDLLLRTHAGMEIGIGIHKDGTALCSVLLGANGSYLAGLNSDHYSWGVLARDWVFEAGIGEYTVELGQKAGELPDKRHVFLFGLKF